jgi:3-isopropylmalate/(R)-2-methylmalate dehydratase small subunit
MRPFTTLRGPAAPMPEADIDTDIIFPARFLLRTEKKGLGDGAFHDWRFAADGTPRPDFVLNDGRWKGATTIVAGANFGCGSSREHAPWSLDELGIRCVIAPSFGEIFRNNCDANGLLTIVVDAESHARVMAAARSAQIVEIDLVRRRIEWSDGGLDFAIDETRRQSLLNGWDEIDLISRDHGPAIEAFAHAQRARMPWLDTTTRKHP